MNIVQCDICTSFLHGDLDEEIYMMQPKSTSPREKSKVCQLLTSLYGLKQSSRIYNCNFDNFLMKFDFLSTKVDPYVYSTRETPLLITMIFMDNGFKCCVQISKLIKIINHLE